MRCNVYLLKFQMLAERSVWEPLHCVYWLPYTWNQSGQRHNVHSPARCSVYLTSTLLSFPKHIRHLVYSPIHCGTSYHHSNLSEVSVIRKLFHWK